MDGIVDTSVFGGSRGRGRLPEAGAISVVTLAELHLGVLLAPDAATRAARLANLGDVERNYSAIPVDAAIAAEYARVVAAARRLGRRPRPFDALIAATASVHGVPVYTRAEDFLLIPGVTSVLVE